jgi:hypothetical protein
LIHSFRKVKLNLNKKTAIRPISLGIEFVGYKLAYTLSIKKLQLKDEKETQAVQELYKRRYELNSTR